jgi:hypothetical protein
MTRTALTDADRIDRARQALVNGQRLTLADADALMTAYTFQRAKLDDLARRVRFTLRRCRGVLEQGPGSVQGGLARMVLADLGPAVPEEVDPS